MFIYWLPDIFFWVWKLWVRGQSNRFTVDWLVFFITFQLIRGGIPHILASGLVLMMVSLTLDCTLILLRHFGCNLVSLLFLGKLPL